MRILALRLAKPVAYIKHDGDGNAGIM